MCSTPFIVGFPNAASETVPMSICVMLCFINLFLAIIVIYLNTFFFSFRKKERADHGNKPRTITE